MISPSVSVGLTEMGMVSAIGRDVVTSCAAARAGVVRLTEMTCLNTQDHEMFGREGLDGIPAVSGHLVPEISPGFCGPPRAALLGSAALTDLLKRRPLNAAEAARCGVCLNLSDMALADHCWGVFPGGIPGGDAEVPPSKAWETETADIVSTILDRCGCSLSGGHERVLYGANAGIVAAIEQAKKWIRDEVVDRCIVGGIDSYADARSLFAAAVAGVLKTQDNPVGFSPGEAAAFVLLERTDRGTATEGNACASITATAFAEDDKTEFSEDAPIGTATAQSILEALGKDVEGSESLGLVVGDLNGTERRAADWGHALVRLHSASPDIPIGNLPLWIPAACFGEIGAATGFVGLCLVVRGFQRSYTPGEVALLSLASSEGGRGALLVRSTTTGQR